MNQDFDIRLCILTTDYDYYKGQQLTFIRKAGDKTIPVGRVVDQHTADLVNVLADTFASIGAEWSADEQAIRSLNAYIRTRGHTGCLRQLGLLVVVVLSDEDERSVGGALSLSEAQYKPLENDNYPEDLLATVSRVLPMKKFLWNAIIVVPGDSACEDIQDDQGSPSFFGALYQQLAEKTGGYVGSICEDDFDQHLYGVDQAMQKATERLGLEARP